MKAITASLIVTLSLLISGANAHVPSQLVQATESAEACSMFPANNLSFPVNSGNRLVSYATFTQILNRVEAIYAPYFHAIGVRFVIDRRWEDPTVNAYATTESSNQKSIHMFGGLARHPLMTPDGFILVACHEIGHHLGGAPIKRPNMAVTSEGGADYFGTLKCMRTVLAGVDNESVLKRMQLDGDAVKTCNAAFISRPDINTCIRSVMASEALTSTLGSLDKIPSHPTLRNTDTTVVHNTFVNHPEAQCRLDTYLQGALCHVDPSIPLAFNNISQGSCDDSMSSRTFGQRPRCWYSPSDPKQLPGLR